MNGQERRLRIKKYELAVQDWLLTERDAETGAADPERVLSLRRSAIDADVNMFPDDRIRVQDLSDAMRIRDVAKARQVYRLSVDAAYEGLGLRRIDPA